MRRLTTILAGTSMAVAAGLGATTIKRVCAGYGDVPRGTCNATAWTYYQAVKLLG
ncbi:hypothetical protein [Embleya sp. NPDC005971]|uniref:hypothetical protein n=1 Tax=Embleya sp. NPDC005971 TaxID=3156724 RepID=UPI00340A8690